MEEKIYVEFAYIPEDKEGKCEDNKMFLLKKEMSFRPCVGDMIFLKERSEVPFVVDSIILEFPVNNNENREGITAFLSLPKLNKEI